MHRILTFTLVASLISAPVVAAPSLAEPGLRTRTEPTMKCWLGLVENKGCGQRDVCSAGPVERVEYLGSTATGGEVYKVRYQFETDAYVIVPDPKGDAGVFGQARR